MNYCHSDHSPQTSKKVSRSFILAIFALLIFSGLQALVALLSHSSSLLADAGHNLSDVFGLAFSWGAIYLQKRPPSTRFSYGYKRASVLSAFLNAVILIAAAFMIIVNSIEHLLHPQPIIEKWVIILALLGVFVNLGTAFLFKHDDDDLNVRVAFLHLAFDALLSFGVVITGVIIYFTHWYWLDPLAALLIMLIIVFGKWKLFKQSMELILDAVPQGLDMEAVFNYLQSWPDVLDVHDLHIWSLSTTEIALTAHLVVPNRHFEDKELILLSQCLKKEFGIGHVTVQIERGLL